MASSLGLDDWVVIKIVNDSKTRNIKLMGLKLEEGKFHKRNDKHSEISKHDLDNTLIEPGDDFSIYSCGREFLLHSGTIGSFKLYDVSNGDKAFICNLHWECPGRSKKNKVEIQAVSPAPNWTTEIKGFNLDNSGALGKGQLVCSDKEDKSTPPGDDDGSTPPGGDDGGVPPGGDNGSVPPGGDSGNTLPGSDNGRAPPGSDDGSSHPGEDKGSTPGDGEEI